jgi:predicted ArsR family transcriptional regulator
MPLESCQQILECIKKSGQASVAELSKALALTPVTIRHHLESLRSEGLVAEPISRHKPGPGRPEMMYEITSEADSYMPRNYGELCRCLIQAVETPELTSLLIEMGSSLGTSAGALGDTTAIANYLDKRGYFPSLDQTERMIILKLANCPYLEVAENAPTLCEFDRSLIESLFGKEVVMVGRIVNREPVCTFHISN